MLEPCWFRNGVWKSHGILPHGGEPMSIMAKAQSRNLLIQAQRGEDKPAQHAGIQRFRLQKVLQNRLELSPAQGTELDFAQQWVVDSPPFRRSDHLDQWRGRGESLGLEGTRRVGEATDLSVVMMRKTACLRLLRIWWFVRELRATDISIRSFSAALSSDFAGTARCGTRAMKHSDGGAQRNL